MLQIGTGIIDFGALCVELRPFYWKKRISAPMYGIACVLGHHGGPCADEVDLEVYSSLLWYCHRIYSLFTLQKPQVYLRPTQVDFKSTSSRLQVYFKSTSCQLQVDSRSTSSRLQVVFKSTSSRPQVELQVDFKSTSSRRRFDFKSTASRPQVELQVDLK